jgi:hypothetical protein
MERFILSFPTTRHWPLHWATWIQYTISQHIYLRYILILSSSSDINFPKCSWKLGTQYRTRWSKSHWIDIFWDITPWSPLKFNRRFGRTYRLHLQGRRISRARNQRSFPPAFTLVSYRLILRPWRWRRYVPPKRRLTFNGLYGVISHKMVLFISTAEKTSYPSECIVLWLSGSKTKRKKC